MRYFFLTLMMMATVLAGIAGPRQTAAQEVAPEQASGARSDAVIEARIDAIYANYDRFSSVMVSVDAGVVTLSGSVLETELIGEAEDLARKVEGVIAVRNGLVLDTSVRERVRPALDRLGDRATQAVNMVPLVIVGVILFSVIVFFGYLITRFEWPFNKLAPNEFVENLLRQLVRILFFIAAFVVALDIIGATALLGTILGAAGIAGLAIGFAVRDTIENYIASVMLSVRQPFRPNDLVKIDAHEGRVMRLTSRATIIMTQEGNHVRIPNAMVFKGVIINYTRAPERRFDFTLGINADGDLKKALHLGIQSLNSLPFVLKDPAPTVRVEKVGDSSIIIWFGGWIDQRATSFYAARGEAIRVTKDAMEAGGLELPEPIYRLKLEGLAGSLPLAHAATDKSAKAAAGKQAATPTAKAAQAAATESLPHPDKGDPVEEKVEAERDMDDPDDLLSEHAAQE